MSAPRLSSYINRAPRTLPWPTLYAIQTLSVNKKPSIIASWEMDPLEVKGHQDDALHLPKSSIAMAEQRAQPLKRDT